MPAHIGDTRTPKQKEDQAKKKVYELLTESFQSWGNLRRAAKAEGLSSATLLKYLKQFRNEGIVIKREEPVEGKKIGKALYRLASTEPFLGFISEKEFYSFINDGKTIEFSPEEDDAWEKMDLAIKIFSHMLARQLDQACRSETLQKAEQRIESVVDILLKEKIVDLVRVFFRYKSVEGKWSPMSGFVAESLMIDANESAEKCFDDIHNSELRKSLSILDKYHPEGMTLGLWMILTSKTKEEAIQRMKEEIESIN